MNAMPRLSAVSHDSDEFLLFDAEIASLYTKYPDLTFKDDNDLFAANSSNQQEEAYEQFESPVSTTDEGNSSWVSHSTDQTTPLRPIGGSTIFPESAEDDHQTFTRLLRESDLPQKNTEYYTGLACRMLHIGGLLFPPEPQCVSQENVMVVLRLCRTIMSMLEYSCSKVDEQLYNIVYIRSLGPFTVQVNAVDDLWSNYKQMATLVIKHTACPSHTELGIIEGLLAVFDAYVYHAALQSVDVAVSGQQVRICLDSVHNTLQDLVRKHRDWCMAMMRMRRSHMQPAMGMIMASNRVIHEITRLEEQKKSAGRSSCHQVITRAVVGNLSEGARRKRLEACRLKTRFKRELTI